MTGQRLRSLNRKWPKPSPKSARGYKDVVAPSWPVGFWDPGAALDAVRGIGQHRRIGTAGLLGASATSFNIDFGQALTCGPDPFALRRAITVHCCDSLAGGVVPTHPNMLLHLAARLADQ